MKRPLRALSRLNESTPLRVKLISAVLLLVLMGLATMAVVTVSILQRDLFDRLDSQISTTSALELQYVQHSWYQKGPRGKPRSPLTPPILREQTALTGEIMQLRASNAALVQTVPTPDGTSPAPAIPTSAAWLSAHVGEIITVGSHGGSGKWRVQVSVVERPTESGPRLQTESQPYWFLVNARSTDEVVHTVHSLVLTEAIVGGLIALAVLSAGAFIVTASLRPLNEIERTAESIAGGKLSARIPPRDPRTEVGRLAGSLNGMLTQIESAFKVRAESELAARASEERMRQFVADAGHELRTPLSVIRGFAEYYRQRGRLAEDELDQLMTRIESAAGRMGTLVEDLLLLARIDQQRPMESEPVDLLAVAADAVQDARLVAPKRSIELTVAEGPAYIVVGDEMRLRQVVANLVGNALAHTPEESPVKIALHPGSRDSKPTAVLDVTDQGPGLSDDDAERIFERFYRVDKARSRDVGGNGLGLAIVHGIVAAHGGAVSVKTALGKGATFTVELPLESDGEDPA